MTYVVSMPSPQTVRANPPACPVDFQVTQNQSLVNQPRSRLETIKLVAQLVAFALASLATVFLVKSTWNRATEIWTELSEKHQKNSAISRSNTTTITLEPLDSPSPTTSSVKEPPTPEIAETPDVVLNTPRREYSPLEQRLLDGAQNLRDRGSGVYRDQGAPMTRKTFEIYCKCLEARDEDDKVSVNTDFVGGKYAGSDFMNEIILPEIYRNIDERRGASLMFFPMSLDGLNDDRMGLLIVDVEHGKVFYYDPKGEEYAEEAVISRLGIKVKDFIDIKLTQKLQSKYPDIFRIGENRRKMLCPQGVTHQKADDYSNGAVFVGKFMKERISAGKKGLDHDHNCGRILQNTFVEMGSSTEDIREDMAQYLELFLQDEEMYN